MKFRVLGSSSAGNCGLLHTQEACVLIDAGLSGLRTRKILDSLGHAVEDIQAVFLTHEHHDHTAGVLGLSKYPHIQFFANRDTADAVQRKIKRPVRWSLFETGDALQFKDIRIKTLSIPHDAYDPVGYVFQTGNNPEERLSLAWVTDLGHIPPAVKQAIHEVDLLIIEANYDEALLEQDAKRPWALKQRIRGRHGHLSNADTHAFITGHPHAKWKHIQLVHLSRDCNNVSLVRETFATLSQPGKRLNVTVFDPAGGPGDLLDLRGFAQA